MYDILFPVLVVAGIGLLAGLGLAIASVVMAVPKDEKAEKITEMLPGANCGACGFSGCSGYAAALAKGEAKPGLCSPGGAEVAAEISEFLGLGGVSVEKRWLWFAAPAAPITPRTRWSTPAFRAAPPPFSWPEDPQAASMAVWVLATASTPANTARSKSATALLTLIPRAARAARCALLPARST